MSIEIIRSYLNNPGNLGNSIHHSFALQLQEAIEKNDKWDIKKDFLSKSADLINEPLPNGELPLHFAIQKNSDQIIELLLQSPEIDLTKQDNQGLTAIDLVFLTKSPEVQALVIAHFLKQNVDSIKHLSESLSEKQITTIRQEIFIRYSIVASNPFYKAALKGTVKEIEEFQLSSVELNQPSEKGLTALQYAVLGENEAVVRWLLEKGVRTELLTEKGATLLHLASEGKNTNIIKILIEKGLDLNCTDKFGYTPLHYAAINENFTNIHLLIENGANPLIKTHKVLPLTIIVSLLKHHSDVIDPLKLDPIQTTLTLFYTALWIESYFGQNINTEVVKFALSMGLNYALTANLFNHLFQIYRRSNSEFFNKKPLIGRLLILIGMLSSLTDTEVPVLGEIFFFLKMFAVVEDARRKLAAAWRNRNLDPLRSCRNIFIYSINGGFSVWNFLQKIQGVYKDTLLQDQINRDLREGKCEDALHHVGGFHHTNDKTFALKKIATNPVCLNSKMAWNAMQKLPKEEDRNEVLKIIADKFLAAKDCKNASYAAIDMEKDERQLAFEKIAVDENCIENGEAISATRMIFDNSKKDKTLFSIVKNLIYNRQYSEALTAASKIARNRLRLIAEEAVTWDPNLQGKYQTYVFKEYDFGLENFVPAILNRTNIGFGIWVMALYSILRRSNHRK